MCAIGTGSESNPAVSQQNPPQKKEPRRRREERRRLSLSSHRLWPSSPAAARPADRNHHPHSAEMETGDVLTRPTAAVPPVKGAQTRDVTLSGPTQGRRSQAGTIFLSFFGNLRASEGDNEFTVDPPTWGRHPQINQPCVMSFWLMAEGAAGGGLNQRVIMTLTRTDFITS